MKNIEELAKIVVNYIPADRRPTVTEFIKFSEATLEKYFNEVQVQEEFNGEIY